MSNEQPDMAEVVADIPPPTIPANLQMSLRGFESEDAARKFGDLLAVYVSAISSWLDLERLDGITVAYQYAEALAQLDRGYETRHELKPTSELALGIAMTPAVKRNGVIKAHMVFDAGLVRLIENQQHEQWKTIFYTVAHECAHVHDLKFRDTALPGVILERPLRDVEEAILWQISDCCWDEYAASRLSAAFGPDQTKLYEETFVTALNTVRDRADALIRAYRLHGDHGRVLTEVSREYAALMKFSSYLIGHLAGIGADLSAAPQAKAILEKHWFNPFFYRITDALDRLWGRYGKWTELAEFDVIGAIGRDVIADGGVHMSRTASGGLHVRVPYTASTLP